MADYGLWLSGFGQWGGLAASEGYTGFDFNLYGSTLGYDRYLGHGLTAGVSLGYANTQLYYEGGRGTGLTNSLTGSAYGSYATGPLHLDTALSYGRQSYENSRTVEVGSIERTAASDHGSNALLASLGGGLTLGRQPWTIEPLASAQYVYLNEDGFTEQGAGSVSLKVQERTAYSLVSDLGLRLGLCLDFGRRALASELFAAWRHDFALDPGTITASFVDAPDAPFTVSGPESQRNGVLLGASLLLKDSGRFSAALKYNLELRGSYRANSLSGEIQYGGKTAGQYGSSRAGGPQ
jgi:subtilase-type serine protease